MRNQLLRDADWAGMAHGVEIRVPLVDMTLLQRFAPAIPTLTARNGKAALAQAPSLPLPAAIVARAKTGFGVPTRGWLDNSMGPLGQRQVRTKGIDSRDWSRVVFGKLSAQYTSA
jgi:asparagine synthase (glutamine-hydrolysing)